MIRGRILDGLILLALLFAGVALRLPLVALFDFSSDSTDPIIAALRMLESWNFVAGDSARFGYGRALSYVPLVLGVDDGLAGFAVRRVVAQALIAPATYLSVRMLLGALHRGPLRRGEYATNVSCAVSAGALMVINQDLRQNLIWGHHGYLGPEWAALLLLGFCGLLVGAKPRLWAALSGVALGMCVMNHPYAIALTPLLWVAWSEGHAAADASRAQAVIVAAGLALVVLLPHFIYVVVTAGGTADILEAVAAHPLAFSTGRPVEVLQGLLSNLSGSDALLWALSLLVVLSVGGLWSSREEPSPLVRLVARFGLGVTLCWVSLWLLALLSRQVHNWHWRMLLPFGACCFGLALAGVIQQLRGQVRTRQVSGLVALVTLMSMMALFAMSLATGYQRFHDPPQQPVESLLQLGQIERVYGLMERHSGEAPWTVFALGSPPQQSYARALPLGLQRVLSVPSQVSFATTETDWLGGPILYYVEAPADWIAALDGQLPGDVKGPLWRGARSLAVRLDSEDQLRAFSAAICSENAGRLVRVDSPRELVALLEMVGLANAPPTSQHLSLPSSCLHLAPISSLNYLLP